MRCRIFSMLVALAGLASAGVRGGMPVPPEICRDGLTSDSMSVRELMQAGAGVRAVALAGPLAEKGDAGACRLLGQLYGAAGEGGASMVKAARYFYQKGAELGDMESGSRMLLHQAASGNETERKHISGVLREAAGKGDVRACRMLAEGWETGAFTGTPDPAEALAWWRKAADLGDGTALVAAGAALLAEVPARDEAAGRAYLEKAAERKIGSAFRLLGRDAERRDAAVAVGMYRRGAELGDAACLFRLAEMRLAADGGAAEGLELLGKAAAAGHPRASLELARRRLPGDVTGAYPLLIAAAREDVWEAQYELGVIYQEGGLGAPDIPAAIGWLTKAMDSGNPEVLYRLGRIHEQGIGCPVNYGNAGLLYTEASQRGHAGAAARIAWMAAEGIGTKRNPVHAWAYAKRAVDLGDGRAGPLLASLQGMLDESQKQEAEKVLAELARPPGAAGARAPAPAK